MEHTEKRYFRMECPLENISVLCQVFDPLHFFQITLAENPAVHYFLFTRDSDLVMARGFSRVNHFPYASITRDEFQRLHPPEGKYLMRGEASLSPWTSTDVRRNVPES